MNGKRLFILILAIVLSAIAADVIAATVTQGTAFTYQGQLNAGGTLPSGQTYYFTFTLYDAASGGSMVGAAIPRSLLIGNGGLFTTDLDFGQIFNGTQYWLDIQVGIAANNELPLAARQPINAVPVAQYALYALNTPPGTFAEFYHTYAGGQALVVLPGDAIPFPNLGPSSGSPIFPIPGGPPNFLSTQFLVSASGTYEATFEVSTSDAGGDALAIYVNAVSVPHAQISQGTKTLVGKFLLTLNAGDVISVVNIGFSALYLQGFLGATTDANLVIRLLH